MPFPNSERNHVAIRRSASPSRRGCFSLPGRAKQTKQTKTFPPFTRPLLPSLDSHRHQKPPHSPASSHQTGQDEGWVADDEMDVRWQSVMMTGMRSDVEPEYEGKKEDEMRVHPHLLHCMQEHEEHVQEDGDVMIIRETDKQETDLLVTLS